MTSYLTSIDTFSLSRTVFEVIDFKVLKVWPRPLTFKGHMRSKIFLPFLSPYMTFYLTFIETFSLSRTFFEIIDIKFFNVWPWPLTFEGQSRLKIFSTFESLYMTPYLTSIDIFFLSLTVFEVFEFIFKVWPWPLTFKGHLRSKIFSPFESPYITSYLTWHFLSISYRFWDIRFQHLTFRGHLRSKILPFESPYITSYLTSIDTFSLSCTVFEIFDFKVFRVWLWPSPFRAAVLNLWSADHWWSADICLVVREQNLIFIFIRIKFSDWNSK